MWEIRRIRKDNHIYLGVVYHLDDEPKYAIRSSFEWYCDWDTTELEEQIANAFRLPVVDSSELTEEVF